MSHSKLTEEEQATRLLTPAQVAVLLGVDPKTVRRWSNEGRLPVNRTPGGHRRFRYSDIQPFLTADHNPIVTEEVAPDATV